MPRGGARPGAGRPKGAKSWKALIDRPVLNGIKPLDFLLGIVASPEAPTALRMLAAKEALPYVHRKLAPQPAAKGDGEADAGAAAADAGWGDDLGPARPN